MGEIVNWKGEAECVRSDVNRDDDRGEERDMSY